MTQGQGTVGFSGKLVATHTGADGREIKRDGINRARRWLAGKAKAVKNWVRFNALPYRIRNTMRPAFIRGWLSHQVAAIASKFGVMTMRPMLRGTLIRANGERFDLGVLSYRSVTTAFCEFMVDQLIAETSVWGDFKWHDSGIGVTAENITDTDIETTDAESRVSGTQVESTTVIYESVGTIAYTTTKAITEHGLFSIVTAGTLMDRTVFSAINVVNGDSIQFTYDLTCTAGG